MTKTWKTMLVGLAAAVVVATPPVAHAAACGDLDNNGSFNSIDCLTLAQCLVGGGTCPSVSPGPLCATGDLADCGDLFGDGDVSLGGLAADLAVCVDTQASLATLFDACQGPGPDIACAGPIDPETGKPTASLNSQTITASQTWPNTCTIRLAGTVFVDTPLGGPTTVLTIEPGTVVKGVVGSGDPAALIFLPGARIDAQGTPASPIIFTSSNPVGGRTKGDWAGVMFNGRSTVNRPGCLANAEGVPTAFGGCDENDSSGIAQFVRAEFAGLDFTPNNELNLWTMNAIGTQTRFDYIQANVGDDDCLEWFGGTSNHKHMVGSGCGDDGFDWQLGWTGSLQYGLVLQHGNLTDPTNRDSRGIEADNSEFGNDDLPRSNPDLCNLTLVSDRTVGDNGGSDVGILLRRGSAGTIANAIVSGFQDAGVELRDSATTQVACSASSSLNPNEPNLRVRNSVFYDNGSTVGAGTEHCKRSTCVDAGGTEQPGPVACNVNADCADPSFPFCGIRNNTCASCDWYNLLVAGESVANANGSNATNPGVSLSYPTGGNLYDGRPTGTLVSPAGCKTINPLFDNTGYVGAFDPGAACTVGGPSAACDWLSKPWISFATN